MRPLVSLGLLLVGLSGCMYTPTTVKLPKLPLGAGTAARTHEVVLIGPFVDARQQRGRCGMKKNGYNGDTGDILCAEEPATWLASRLASDLRASGVLVHDAPHASELRIEGTLMEFFSEAQPGAWTVEYETDIHVRLKVTWPDGVFAERDIYVKGVEGSAAPTNEVLQDSVDEATTQIARVSSMAVLMLLDRQDAYRGAAR